MDHYVQGNRRDNGADDNANSQTQQRTRPLTGRKRRQRLNLVVHIIGSTESEPATTATTAATEQSVVVHLNEAPDQTLCVGESACFWQRQQ